MLKKKNNIFSQVRRKFFSVWFFSPFWFSSPFFVIKKKLLFYIFILFPPLQEGTLPNYFLQILPRTSSFSSTNILSLMSSDPTAMRHSTTRTVSCAKMIFLMFPRAISWLRIFGLKKTWWINTTNLLTFANHLFWQSYWSLFYSLIYNFVVVGKALPLNSLVES